MAARGYRCVLTIGGNPVGYARNVEPTLTAGDQDITTRLNRGFEDSQPGKRGMSFTIEALHVPSYAAISALETSYFNQALVAFTLYDENNYGWQGNCWVKQIRRGPEDQDNAVMAHIECKVAGEFFRVIAGSTTYAV